MHTERLESFSGIAATDDHGQLDLSSVQPSLIWIYIGNAVLISREQDGMILRAQLPAVSQIYSRSKYRG